MNKNEQFTVKIEDYSNEGLGIGKTDAGFVWFIKDTVIGDTVLAAATKVKKNYGFARLVNVIEPSENRVVPQCGIARRCGGCQLQQMSYEAQLKFKQDKVYNNLSRIGEVDKEILDHVFQPIAGMDKPFRYRNKAQFPISRNKDGRIIAGFYAGRTHDVIECDDCLLGVKENKIILDKIIAWMEENDIEPYDENSGKGLVRHVLIKKGFKSGERMVCLVINGTALPCREELVESLCNGGQESGKEITSEAYESIIESYEKYGELPEDVLGIKKRDVSSDNFSGESPEESLSKLITVDSLSFSVNMERTNVIMGTKIVNVYGPGYIEDYIGRIKFRISPLSFYQVNPVQTEKMYGTALEFADLDGTENVWDLYCGIGTISLFMSQKAKKVYGVEIIPEAIRDAKQNAVINGIDNAEFYVGAAEEVLPEWYKQHPDERIDVVCVDPPRKGCDERALATIVEMAPEKIVYVSCDSATLARDVKYLRANGYELTHVKPIDNFSQTVHVETVVLLQKVN
ncbi:23S rRNA (uracil(1939)-C(5))-methyltransferase RlmD [Oribacterium sp. WCC10]|uniref:23S rRNA (uracil(1939)-C(5))-methyltransferase RlmD n=1 Tax=Oribacterium sp. WCC10 TaxID=1855343 RepID=UPI0008E27D13|nr:23S rRNA (uracil(1939)-C(5))-methyltransferase RlmD [Oribacterium sp. WCC10]SFG15854.1 23S rRNA (uracil1939-C5)-methyltransferase [Oribacterium sp. WCC10]